MKIGTNKSTAPLSPRKGVMYDAAPAKAAGGPKAPATGKMNQDSMAFDLADKDGSTKLSLAEFQGTMKPGAPAAAAKAQFARLDANKDGGIDRMEFVRGGAPKPKAAPAKEIDIFNGDAPPAQNAAPPTTNDVF
jgi:Ca2+-binding EF-hand superfamily protein